MNSDEPEAISVDAIDRRHIQADRSRRRRNEFNDAAGR
jgi:hypothetical protein